MNTTATPPAGWQSWKDRFLSSAAARANPERAREIIESFDRGAVLAREDLSEGLGSPVSSDSQSGL